MSCFSVFPNFSGFPKLHKPTAFDHQVATNTQVRHPFADMGERLEYLAEQRSVPTPVRYIELEVAGAGVCEEYVFLKARRASAAWGQYFVGTPCTASDGTPSEEKKSDVQ